MAKSKGFFEDENTYDEPFGPNEMATEEEQEEMEKILDLEKEEKETGENQETTHEIVPSITETGELPVELKAEFEELLKEARDLLDVNVRIRLSPNSREFETSVGDSFGKEFEAVIVYFHPMNMYWGTGYDPTSPSPPTCYSMDGKLSITGKSCEGCEFNQYGSAKQGKGKACKNVYRLFLLRENDPIIYQAFVPPTSLKYFRNYLLSQLKNHKVIQWQTTKFKVDNSKPWGIWRFERGRELTPEEIQLVSKLRKEIKEKATRIEFEEEEDELE